MEIKNKYIQRAYELGFLYEKSYHGCAQCTVAAIQDALSIRNDYVFKAASSLGGGIARMTDGVCGGYSGGVMMLSLFFGRERGKFANDKDARTKTNKLVTQLHDKFIEECGTIICQKIHKKLFGRTFNLWNPKDREIFNASGAHKDKCTNLVANASAWSTKLILDSLTQEGLSLKNLKFLEYIIE